jgi:hypothetical protein
MNRVNTIRMRAGSALVSVAIAISLADACGGSERSEREMLSADAEVFEAIVRAQVSQTPDDSAVAMRVLRIDSRPTLDNTQLRSAPQAAVGVDLDEPTDTLPPEAMSRIAEQRKEILADLHVEEGGPFIYPGCGGTRPHPPPNPGALQLGTACPSVWRRYVTVGLPVRGEAEVLAKLRSRSSAPTGSSAESWTVLVTENTIGPAGQMWQQYACLLRRDQVTGHFGLAERFLLSWAE